MEIAVIGGGTIGSAIAEGLKKKGYGVTATRRSVEKLQRLAEMGVQVTSDNAEAVRKADVVIVALKPYDALEAIPKVSGEMRGKILISMIAAVKMARIKALAPDSIVVRAMTNVAAKVGGGYTVYCSNMLDASGEKDVISILGCLGETERVEERYMDALTALSGSGPAYIFTIIEAMVYAGLKVGLPRELALRSSYQTILGSAKLVRESGYHPSELRDLVTTPGGVTIDALYELEDSGIRTAFMRAIESATGKAKTISDSLDL